MRSPPIIFFGERPWHDVSSSRMPSGPKSNRCYVTSNTPPGSPPSSATGCSLKPSSTKHAPARRGATCPRRSVTGMPFTSRFRRWETRTIWKRLWERIHRSQNDCLQELFIDLTMVQAHQHAAGGANKTADN